MSSSRFTFPATFTLSLLAPLAACNLGERAETGECPPGEICSDDTPSGLNFDGASLSDGFLDFGPHPTLVGGTQAIRLEYAPDAFGFRPLDLPYLADDEGGRGVKVDHTSGSVVTLRGVAAGSNYLRITDPGGDLYDRKQVSGARLTEIRVVPTRSESIVPGEAVVFAPGAQDVTVALVGETEGGGRVRAVDESMTIALPGANRTRWDTLRFAAATVGHHALTVTAGDCPAASLDVEVVAGADALVAQVPLSPIVVGQGSFVCFSAHAAGRHVAGLAWTFSSDNGPIQVWLDPNCAAVQPERAGTLTVTASAGGQTLAAAFTVAAQARRGGASPPAAHGSAAGERAAAVEARLAAAAAAAAR